MNEKLRGLIAFPLAQAYDCRWVLLSQPAQTWQFLARLENGRGGGGAHKWYSLSKVDGNRLRGGTTNGLLQFVRRQRELRNSREKFFDEEVRETGTRLVARLELGQHVIDDLHAQAALQSTLTSLKHVHKYTPSYAYRPTLHYITLH